MSRHLSLPVSLLAMAALATGATLERLTVDDMIAKSTDIVRARVTAENGAAFRGNPSRGGLIYSHYTITVSERWKGTNAPVMDVAVPGGVAQGLRQTFVGAPALYTGQEYVFFLWTSRSGLTQIIGLTQGVLNLKVDASGNVTANRAGGSETMIDPVTGQVVSDPGVNMTLSDLRARVTKRSKAGQ